MKGSVKEKMEQARLDDLMPGFDRDREWSALSEQLGHNGPKPKTGWKLAAAVALLLGAGAVLTLVLTSNNNDQIAQTGNVRPVNWRTEVAPAVPQMPGAEADTTPESPATAIAGDDTKNQSPSGGSRLAVAAPDHNAAEGYSRTKEFVCNGTPCPLEICIIQTIRCKDKAPSAVATCNTLEPDQARQLHYKAPEALGAQCKVTVDEIRIRRVTTGETIVLNAHSKPSTAQELFNCITGNEKCNLLAGIFEADCNNQQRSHSLKIDNTMGSLIME